MQGIRKQGRYRIPRDEKKFYASVATKEKKAIETPKEKDGVWRTREEQSIGKRGSF